MCRLQPSSFSPGRALPGVARVDTVFFYGNQEAAPLSLFCALSQTQAAAALPVLTLTWQPVGAGEETWRAHQSSTPLASHTSPHSHCVFFWTLEHYLGLRGRGQKKKTLVFLWA